MMRGSRSRLRSKGEKAWERRGKVSALEKGYGQVRGSVVLNLCVRVYIMIYVHVCLKYVRMSICISAIHTYNWAHMHTHVLVTHLDLSNSSWQDGHCFFSVLSAPAACH